MFDAVRNVLASPLRGAMGLLQTPSSSRGKWNKLGENDEENVGAAFEMTKGEKMRLRAAHGDDKENMGGDFSFPKLASPVGGKTPLRSSMGVRRTPLSTITAADGNTPASIAGSAKTVFESPMSDFASFGGVGVDLTPPASECATPPQLGKTRNGSAASLAVLTPPALSDEPEEEEASAREAVVTLLGGASCLPGMDAYGRSTPSKLDGESDGTEQPEEAQSRAPLAPLDANAAAARRAANPQAAALSLLDDFAEEASSRRIHAAVAQAKERALGGRAAAARGAHAAAQGASQVAGRVSVLWAPRARPAAAPEAELVGVNVESGVAAADGAAPQPQAAAAGAEQLAREQQAALNRQWQLERNLRKTCDTVDDIESKFGGLSIGGGR